MAIINVINHLMNLKNVIQNNIKIYRVSLF